MHSARTARLAIALLSCTVLWGCPSGESRDLPPGEGGGSGVRPVFYVAEATDEDLQTSGGRVSVYRLDGSGLLPEVPSQSIEMVNPRRLLVHEKAEPRPVLYVAGANQIRAFRIAEDGRLDPVGCPAGDLAPPCATEPRAGADPVDMSLAQRRDGGWMLYVSEAGNGQNIDIQTRVVAYPLRDDGGLPSDAGLPLLPVTQWQDFFSVSYLSATAFPDLGERGYAYLSDNGTSRLVRVDLREDGGLPNPATSPTPIGAPSPTPTPTPQAIATPTPTTVVAQGPGRMAKLGFPLPASELCPAPPVRVTRELLYVVLQNKKRMSVYVLKSLVDDPDGTMSDNPASESNTRGVYNAMLISPCATHIYGAAFNNGQVDAFELDENGFFLDGPQSATFSDPSSYPTGLAWLEMPDGSGPALLVSVGGLGRVDAYRVPGGVLEERPFSSTREIEGSFPADVAAWTPPRAQ